MATKIYWSCVNWEILGFPCDHNVMVTREEVQNFSSSLIKAAEEIMEVSCMKIRHRNLEFYAEFIQLFQRPSIRRGGGRVPSDDPELLRLQRLLVLPHRDTAAAADTAAADTAAPDTAAADTAADTAAADTAAADTAADVAAPDTAANTAATHATHA